MDDKDKEGEKLFHKHFKNMLSKLNNIEVDVKKTVIYTRSIVDHLNIKNVTNKG